MLKPRHDQAFRETAVAAVDGGESIRCVAQRFGVHPHTLQNWLRLRRETGSVRGIRMRLGTKELETLRVLCLAHPDATNKEMCELLVRACDVRLTERMMSSERRRLGFKRVPLAPARGSREAATGRPGGYKGAVVPPWKKYPSDLTDAQWELIAPLLPGPKPGGKRQVHDRRVVVDAILYVLRTGCQWRSLPHDFPPWQTVYDLFREWSACGVWERANTVLRERVRVREGRNPTPSAAVMDTQVAKTTEKGGSVDSMAASA